MEQGCIILVRFPFTNIIDYKIRPALVVSNAEFNKKFDFWACPITTKEFPENIEITKSIIEGELDRKSFARTSNIFTIKKELVLKAIGKLSKEKTKEIIKELIKNME
jgi:mRNA-degrading endonuclease toxin of MazEF toxin-antitoxin module